jgi:hypothetical protein
LFLVTRIPPVERKSAMNEFERTPPALTENPTIHFESSLKDSDGIKSSGSLANLAGSQMDSNSQLHFSDPFVQAQSGNVNRSGCFGHGEHELGEKSGQNDNVGAALSINPVLVERVAYVAPSNVMYPNNNAIMKYFIDKSLTKQQAAGIVGNLDQESCADPNRHQYGGGPGYGLAQWEEGGRLGQLRQFAASERKPVSGLGVQLDFIWHELNTTESFALRSLRGTTNAAQAADVFERTYERAGSPQLRNREAYANQALAQYA